MAKFRFSWLVRPQAHRRVVVHTAGEGRGAGPSRITVNGVRCGNMAQAGALIARALGLGKT